MPNPAFALRVIGAGGMSECLASTGNDTGKPILQKWYGNEEWFRFWPAGLLSKIKVVGSDNCERVGSSPTDDEYLWCAV